MSDTNCENSAWHDSCGDFGPFENPDPDEYDALTLRAYTAKMRVPGYIRESSLRLPAAAGVMLLVIAYFAFGFLTR